MPKLNARPKQADIGNNSTNATGSSLKSRRGFLSYLLAGAGSLTLAGCGGSSDAAERSANTPKASSSATVSSSGTTVPPATSISDSAGNTWTLASGAVTKNGSAVSTGAAGSLVLILYYNGTIYAKDASGTWFKNGSPWQNLGTADPRTAATSTSSTPFFYGLNGHMAYNSGIYHTMSAAAQLAMIKDLGATMYRCDVAGSDMAKVLATALTGPFANSGVSIFPVLNPSSAGWSTSLSESAAYTLGYNLGTSATTPLKGLVSYIECGNELDVPVVTNGDGSNTVNYNPAAWPAFRGVIRGMIDGVKAIDSTIKVGVNVGIPLAYRALQMLWSGITPDGSVNGVTGAASVRWDITCYHWYESSGDIVCGWRNNACYDVLQALKDSFGVPIFLTEWGWTGPTDTTTQQAAYVTRALTEYKSIKDKYNIQSVMMYAMIDDQYGLVKSDGVTKLPAYSAFKSFVAANPV